MEKIPISNVCSGGCTITSKTKINIFWYFFFTHPGLLASGTFHSKKFQKNLDFSLWGKQWLYCPAKMDFFRVSAHCAPWTWMPWKRNCSKPTDRRHQAKEENQTRGLDSSSCDFHYTMWQNEKKNYNYFLHCWFESFFFMIEKIGNKSTFRVMISLMSNIFLNNVCQKSLCLGRSTNR